MRKRQERLRDQFVKRGERGFIVIRSAEADAPLPLKHSEADRLARQLVETTDRRLREKGDIWWRLKYWWLPRDIRDDLIEQEAAIRELQRQYDLFEQKFKEHMDTLGGKR